MRSFFILFLVVSLHCGAQNSRYDSLWNDAAIEKRITEGIEKNRKGDATILLPNLKGEVEIEIQQVKHDFQFGANIFMLKGFKTEAENERYETLFKEFFNTACAPFYWKELEPEQGKLRYAANSNFVYRRPPPDLVLDFCKKNGITPKGHTLVWDNTAHAVPTWLTKDTSKIQPFIDARIKDLALRYGGQVKTWDVVNEVLEDHPNVPMPAEYPLRAFRTAHKYFPQDVRLFINEATYESWQHYHREYTPYKLLIEHLQSKGVKIEGIGLQFHFFREQWYYDALAGKTLTPTDLFRSLDMYGKFKVPLHISEITIPALPNNEEGLANQAKLTRNYYRLWFSHPAVEAIIWWNLGDGTAVAGEDKWRGGFVDEAMQPKPSYHALNDLINKEWKTNFTTKVNKNTYAFRGFYGDYVAKVSANGKTKEYRFSIKKGLKNELKIEL